MLSHAARILITALMWFCANASASNAEFIWGVNGHPFKAYPDISFEQQLKLVRGLGTTSYRVDVSTIDHIPRLARLISEAKPLGITILPVLTPALALDKETPETLYKQAHAFAVKVVSEFKDDVRVWELGNELENFAILKPCEIQDDGVQYNCNWGPASGVGPLEYHGGRWSKVSAVLKGLSEGTISVDPEIRKAMGTAGWGHVGAFERMRQDGIQWDISVWHLYGDDPEWGFKRIAPFGKPIWVTEFNQPNGSQKGAIPQGAGLRKMIARFRELKDKYNVEAAHIYELLDESYWAPSFEAFMGLVYLKKDDGKWATAERKPAYCVVRTLLSGGFRLAASPVLKETFGAGSGTKATGALPRRQCDLCLFDNRDARSDNKIDYSYCLALGTKAKDEVRASLIAELENGRDIKDIVLDLVESDEFNQLYHASQLSNSDFIILIYRLFFDRDPDGHGHGQYLAAMDKGKLSRSNFLKQMIGSDEFRGRNNVLFRQSNAGLAN